MSEAAGAIAARGNSGPAGAASRPAVSELELSSAEAQTVRLLAGEWARRWGRADNAEFLAHLPGLGRWLPDSVFERLRGLRAEEDAPALVVRGFPVDDASIGPTPAHWRQRPPDRTGEEDFWLAAVTAPLGEVFCWSSLQDGRLLNDVHPIRGEERQQTGHSSSTDLDFHVEDAFDELRCDYLALLCLRNPARTATTVSRAEVVTATGVWREALFEPRFRIDPDPEHLRARPAGMVRRPVAALFGDRVDPYVRVDPAYMRPVDGDRVAREALAMLCADLRDGLVEVVLGPGDLLVIDNYRAVHGRRPFPARYDGTDRWLRKALVTRDLRASRRRRADAAARLVCT